MSGSFSEGIGQDGCLERDQVSRIQMKVLFENKRAESKLFRCVYGLSFTRIKEAGPGSWITGWSRRSLVRRNQIKLSLFMKRDPFGISLSNLLLSQLFLFLFFKIKLWKKQ